MLIYSLLYNSVQPEKASSLRRHVVASLMQHHRSVQRNSRAIQPVLPASYESSMEVRIIQPFCAIP